MTAQLSCAMPLIAEPTAVLSSMPTLATEYIGNKRLLLGFITDAVQEIATDGPLDILDLFAGTGVVSATFKSLGYVVSANDHLATCFNLTAAALLNDEAPSFDGLRPFFAAGSRAVPTYQDVLGYLNALPAESGGFVHSNFSPASMGEVGLERRYFTEANAKRIDVVRTAIEQWRPLITEAEHALLLADLVRAVSRVSNVAGTYGCYLKQWKARALDAIALRPSAFIKGRSRGHSVTCAEAEEAIGHSQARFVYADPPYTKRQYAAYYHVLETIVRNDRPILSGSTGLRDWAVQSSDFCYKRRADGALERLLQRVQCEHFLLSYSDDGQIPHERILEILNAYGQATYRETAIRRYRSSDLDHKGPLVVERLYHLVVG